MDFLLDNKETEEKYRKILQLIQSGKNGDVAKAMKDGGIDYKYNFGVSIIDLREISLSFKKDHLLALKLWNKQWRETMILATLIDNPQEVTEEQMDFWTRTFGNTEIAEQASANLWVHTKFAFAKGLEWSRGIKHLVRFTGVHLAGRLAAADKNAIDEMFDPFLHEFLTLSKDSQLHTSLFRTTVAFAKRSKIMYEQMMDFSRELQLSDSKNAASLGENLFEEISSSYFRELIAE